MFEELAESKIDAYYFKLENLEVNDEIKLLFKLQDKHILMDLIDYNENTFKEDYNGCYEEIMEAFKKKGYTLRDYWYHNDKRMSMFDFNNIACEL